MATVEKNIEVNQPVRTVYNQWTQFEEFPEFMEGVEKVVQLDDTHLRWTAEIAGAQRAIDVVRGGNRRIVVQRTLDAAAEVGKAVENALGFVFDEVVRLGLGQVQLRRNRLEPEYRLASHPQRVIRPEPGEPRADGQDERVRAVLCAGGFYEN